MPPAQILDSSALESPFYPSTESLLPETVKMGGMHKMIMPRCAICGKSASTSKGGECPHEGERLLQSLFQAQLRWMDTWWPSIKDWVTNESVKHVTSMFETFRMHRLVSCRATARSLPYFNIYSQYHGQPPPSLVPSASLVQLRTQLTDLDSRLQSQIDDDWKKCARMYPQVLDYFFSQITVSTPNASGTQRTSYSPPRPLDFPTSSLESHSPDLENMANPPQMMVVEDTPLGEIPGGYYTNTGLSAHRSHKTRRPSQGGYVLPTGQHVSMTPTAAYALPPQASTHRRSRRWSAAAAPEAYFQPPMPKEQYGKVSSHHQAVGNGYGGVALQPGEGIPPMNLNLNNGGVRISPPRDASRRRASYIQPSASRNRLSAHFADDINNQNMHQNMQQQQHQQQHQQQQHQQPQLQHQQQQQQQLPPPSSSKHIVSKGSRRPSLPSSHFYSQSGMMPATSTVAGSNKHSRHSSYYQQPPIMAGRQ